MIIKLADSEEELGQILQIQKANHVGRLTQEQKKQEGFVTVRHNLDLLRKMNAIERQVIALDSQKVIAYALVMTKECKDLIPTLVPMFDMFEEIQYLEKPIEHYRYYVMGQICVAEGYRGKGIVQRLYQKHKEAYSVKYELCLTEISSSNPRSLRAHEKSGFQKIHSFKDQFDEWNIVAWDFR